MGNVEYGFEGFDMPVLFTKRDRVFAKKKLLDLAKKSEKKLKGASKGAERK